MKLSIINGELLKILFLSGSMFTLSAQEKEFKSRVVGNGLFDESTKISYLHDDKQVGCIVCTKLPLSFYILHSFFVDPEHRNRGYGSKLLAHACSEIDTQKPRTVFIQPGPFEYIDGEFSDIDEPTEREEKLHRLAKLYARAGFRKAPRPLSLAAALLYKLIGLQEDASYLMVK